MKNVSFTLVLLFFAELLCAQGYTSVNYKNYEEANTIFEKASTVGYQSIDSLSYEMQGTWFYEGHYPTPKERKAIPINLKVTWAKGRLLQSVGEIDYNSQSLFSQQYFTQTKASFVDFGERDTLTAEEAKSNSRLVFYSPVSILEDMQRNKNTIRYLGFDSTDSCHVLSYMSGYFQQASVFIDAKHFTVKRAELLLYSSIQGDYVHQFFYEDYKTVQNAFLLPTRLIQKQWGETLYDMSYRYLVVDSKKSELDLSGYQLKEIGKNLYSVSYPTGNHRVYLVDFGNHLGIIDAPIGWNYSKEVAAFVESKFNGRKIDKVYPTHHHPDHAGGMFYFFQNGAEIVTTPMSAEYFKELANRKHSLRDDSFKDTKQGSFSIVPVGGIITESTKNIKMVIYESGETGHTKEFLYFYFPDLRILIVGDIFYVRDSGVQASVRAEVLQTFIDKHKLKVDCMYQTWPEAGCKEYSTPADLKKSLELYREKQKDSKK